MPVVDASTLSTADVVALIESEQVSVDAGLELLDADDNVIEDISDDLAPEGSMVERGMYRTLHGTCRLRISRELQWGWQRVRPYLLLASNLSNQDYLLDDGGDRLTDDDGVPLVSGAWVEPTYYRWNLGVFLLDTPERVIGESPQTWDVEGYDKLDVLNTPHGSTYTISAGDPILAAVEALIAGAGEAKVDIDQTEAAATAPGERVFSVIDDWSTLGICNELLSMVGYRALSVDRDGWFRSEPYRSPDELATVWTYSADSSTTSVVEDRTAIEDYYGAANVVFGINDEVDTPVDGAGLYTLTNPADGPTSIAGRGGRVIRRRVQGSYASQDALITAVTAALDAEKRVAGYLELGVSPNPVHGHFDVVRYVDAAVPADGRYVVTDWSLPLDGTDMRLSLRSV